MKKTYLIILVILTAIVGCTSKPAKSLKTPPCSAQAGVAQPVDEKHKIFGISLGQPINFPECKKSAFGTGGFVMYESDKQVCYKRVGKISECTLINNGEVLVEFPAMELPFWVESVGASLVNGRVEGVTINTTGIRGQNEAFSTILAKYGNPVSESNSEKQNLMGAKFEALRAIWYVKDLTVILLGAVTRVDSGEVTIVTDIGKKANEANQQNINQNQKSL